MAPDPAAVDAKANEPKEASPAPTESSGPNTSGHAADGTHDGQYIKHTHIAYNLYIDKLLNDQRYLKILCYL